MDIKIASVYGQIAMTVMICAALIAAYTVTYLSGDKASLQMINGAVLGAFTTAASFWLGSSSSSQKKDDVIAASSPPPRVEPPPLTTALTDHDIDRLADHFVAKTAPPDVPPRPPRAGEP
jgi:hypothetical protein